jgi:AraC family transcriptional regulator of adaptative response/methylated-DNA-[protein]-cysteine methyltransferase
MKVASLATSFKLCVQKDPCLFFGDTVKRNIVSLAMNEIINTQNPSKAELYESLLTRNEAFDGFYYVCVVTTKIFCKLSCGARKPLESNVFFTNSTQDAIEKGFRPCKRCRPLQGAKSLRPLTLQLLDEIKASPERRWSGEELKRLGFDASTVRRAFISDFGVSFLKFAREHRLGAVVETLKNGHPIIEAQLDAGYCSASGFKDAVSREIGSNPSEVAKRPLLSAKWLETPIGPMLAIGNSDGLHLLEFAERKALVREINETKKKVGPICFQELPLFDKIQTQLDEYFAGKRWQFDIPVAQYGTQFEKSAWRMLQTIPYGEVRSYSEQAKAIGKPSAFRAVARANGANKIAVLIPCHRVIGSDGTMTGYGGKIWRKEWLLRHEKKNGAQVEPN